MNSRRKGTAGAEVVAEEAWPYCAAVEGTCLAYDVGRYLGASIESALFTFVFTAEQGARLILQKNQAGFTAQVTGAVQRTKGDTLGLEEAQALRKRLDLALRKRLDLERGRRKK